MNEYLNGIVVKIFVDVCGIYIWMKVETWDSIL